MKTIIKSTLVIALAALTTSCIKETESDFDRIMKRDDALVAEYIASKDIQTTKTQIGYHYKKDVEVDQGTQFANNDIIGIYYELKTLDGHLIESYLDENKSPVLFKYSQNGLWPSAMGYAAGLAKPGETFTLIIPSYLAYNTYSYQQLIPSGANLVATVKYVRKYTEDQVKQLEDQMIQAYLAEKELEGFEKNEKGIYIRVVDEGEGEPSKNGNTITFSYEMFELKGTKAIAESTTNNPVISLGSANNIVFLNESLVNLPKGAEVEVIAPSHTAYGETVQVIPSQIRQDLVTKGELQQFTAPYAPVRFNAEIIRIQ
jgi:FKBP-type peptidyl-prolyl cis-trans isomerase